MVTQKTSRIAVLDFDTEPAGFLDTGIAIFAISKVADWLKSLVN